MSGFVGKYFSCSFFFFFNISSLSLLFDGSKGHRMWKRWTAQRCLGSQQEDACLVPRGCSDLPPAFPGVAVEDLRKGERGLEL